MRENNILKSLLKYICITISASFVFVGHATATDMSTFVSGISTTGDWGDEYYYVTGRSGGIATVVNTSTWTSTTSNITLSAGEWRVKKNDYGTIYGTSACNNNGITLTVNTASDTEQSDSGGKSCWCKLTSVSDTDNNPYSINGAKWVLIDNWNDAGGEITYNTARCAEECDSQCSTAFFRDITTGVRTALSNGVSVVMPASIKIATTKYVEDKFAPSVTELNAAISTVKTVVDNTLIQADRIGKLYTGKQNRPDDSSDSEKCPDGRLCLLITEADGSLHWYPIATGSDVSSGSSSSFDVSAFLAQLTSDGDASYAHGNTTTYNELGNTGSAYTYQPSTDSIVRQLNETEWAALWDNKGVVYGTSVCNGNSGTYAVASSDEQTETKGKYCWCKMTSVGDTEKNEYPASGALWVFRSDYGVYAEYCASGCAYDCAYRVQGDAALRGAVLGSGN